MTVQEAIKNLQYLISDDCTGTQLDYVEEIKLAISALEKQLNGVAQEKITNENDR